jgi:hypothetical protein
MARNLLFFVLGLALIVYLRMTLPPAEDAVVADDRECVARTADPEKITRVGFQSNYVFTMSPLYLHPSEAPLYVGGGVLPDFLDRCGARATVYACAASARVVPFLSERNSAARLWPLCCCCRPPPLSPLFSPLTLLLRSLSFSFGNFTRAGMADAISEGRLEVFNITGTSVMFEGEGRGGALVDLAELEVEVGVEGTAAKAAPRPKPRSPPAGPHYFLLPLSGTWSVSDPSSLCTLPPLSSYYLPPPRKRFEDDVVVAGEGVMTVLKVNAMGRVQFPERVVAERERKARALAGDEL